MFPMQSGVEYPIHPLDLTIVTQWTITYDTYGTVCIASIRESGASSRVDWVLGSAFLRNVYSV